MEIRPTSIFALDDYLRFLALHKSNERPKYTAIIDSCESIIHQSSNHTLLSLYNDYLSDKKIIDDRKKIIEDLKSEGKSIYGEEVKTHINIIMDQYFIIYKKITFYRTMFYKLLEEEHHELFMKFHKIIEKYNDYELCYKVSEMCYCKNNYTVNYSKDNREKYGISIKNLLVFLNSQHEPYLPTADNFLEFENEAYQNYEIYLDNYIKKYETANYNTYYTIAAFALIGISVYYVCCKKKKKND